MKSLLKRPDPEKSQARLWLLLLALVSLRKDNPDREKPRTILSFLLVVIMVVGPLTFIKVVISATFNSIRESLRRQADRNILTNRPNNTITPPRFSAYLLFFLPVKQREPVIGDLEEEYHERFRRFGQRTANRWYYAQVRNSWWPLLVNCVKKLANAGIVKWLIH